MRLDVGAARAGTGAPEGDRSQGFTMRNLNALTPETDSSTHYFWGQAHNFGIDDPSITEMLFNQVHTAFLEDLVIVRNQQSNIDAYASKLPDQVDFGQDAGGIRARRIVQDIIDAETRAAVPSR